MMKRTLFLAALAAVVASGVACGGKTRDPKAATAPEPAIDEDPVALLPGAAVAAAHVDARAVYDGGSVGGALAKLSEQYVPIGQEAGFVPSRDVDEVWVGVYSTQGADVGAVLRGRFDAKKIEEAARTKVATRGGAPIVASPYGAYTVYTVSNVGFTVLTERTALVGTDAGMRRILDRLRDKRAQRDVAPWIAQVLDSKGSAASVALDVETNPAAATGLTQVPLPMVRGLKKGKLLARLEPQGLGVDGSLGYADAQQAQTGAGGVRSIAGITNMLALTGVAPKVSGLDAKVVGTDVEYKFSLDESSLRAFLANLPRVLGR